MFWLALNEFRFCAASTILMKKFEMNVISPLNENPMKSPRVPPTFPKVDMKSYRRYSVWTEILPGFSKINPIT